MKIVWIRVFTLLLLLAGWEEARADAGADPPTKGAAEAHIPETRGVALSGEIIALPEILRGRSGVLVLGFSHGSQDAVTAWARRLTATYGDSQTVVFYQMPMLASAPRLVRGMIVRSMKSSMPRSMQARFIPVTTDEPRWRSLAGYSKPDDAYVLLVDGEGRVWWHMEGAATDASFEQMKRQLAVMQAQAAMREGK